MQFPTFAELFRSSSFVQLYKILSVTMNLVTSQMLIRRRRRPKCCKKTIIPIIEMCCLVFNWNYVSNGVNVASVFRFAYTASLFFFLRVYEVQVSNWNHEFDRCNLLWRFACVPFFENHRCNSVAYVFIVKFNVTWMSSDTYFPLLSSRMTLK